jgi:hypothetical protein
MNRMDSVHFYQAFDDEKSYGVIYDRRSKRFLVWIGIIKPHNRIRKTYLKFVNFTDVKIDQESVECKVQSINYKVRKEGENWCGVSFTNCPKNMDWECRSEHVSEDLREMISND